MADSGDRRVPECPICMEAYEAPPSARAPIILACGHCVCRGDAGNIPTGQRDGGALQLCCPTCRQHTPMPEEGLAALPCNYTLVEMIEAQGGDGGDGGDGGAVAAKAAPAHVCNFSVGECDDGAAATHHCEECGEFLCLDCHAMHGRGNRTKLHAVLLLADLAASGGAALPPPPPDTCEAHPGEPKKLWCETCNKCICCDCIVVDHRDHVFNFLPAMFDKHRPEMAAALEQLRARLPPVEASIAELTGVESALAARREVLCAEIGERFDGFVAAVQQRRSEVLAECSALAQAKEKQLVAQREALQGNLASMGAGCAFAARTLERGAVEPAQALLAQAQLTADLRRMEAQPLELQPTECAELHLVDGHPELLAHCTTFGSVSGVGTRAANCTAEGGGLQEARLGQEAEFVVRACDFRGQPRTEGGDAVTVALERAGGAGADECKGGEEAGGGAADGAARVVDNGDGTYRCTFTPAVAGRAALHVRVFGEHIRDSPFAIVPVVQQVELLQGVQLNMSVAQATAMGFVKLKEWGQDHCTANADFVVPKGTKHVLLGAKSTMASDSFLLCAMGDPSIAFAKTTSNSVAKEHNGVYWYNVDSKSIGFAPQSKIGLSSADDLDDEGEKRLSWHWGRGYRAGNQESDDFVKCLWIRK